MNPSQDSACAPRQDSELKRPRSRTIPLPSSHIVRTQSELQLSEDMAAAEWKDLCMFYRVVGGIREQQQQDQCANGAPILHQPQHYQTRHVPATTIRERKPKPVRDWTGKDVTSTVEPCARVTPFDTDAASESPQDRHFIPYPQSLLLKSPRRSTDSGWSITGFEDDSQDASLALVGQDANDQDDEAVFVMDL